MKTNEAINRLYEEINDTAQAVVRSIPEGHVTDYEWLLEHIELAGQGGYQRRFRHYWRMNAARLGRGFYEVYFAKLAEARAREIELGQLMRDLRVPAKGRLQCSFATKLLHCVNPELPIYDSLVAGFYGFEPTANGLPEEKLRRLLTFYAFLKSEQVRVLEGGLLRPAMEAFRERFRPVRFTEQKVVDSLIWGMYRARQAGLVRGGAGVAVI
jgi:hypothetical protein